MTSKRFLFTGLNISSRGSKCCGTPPEIKYPQQCRKQPPSTFSLLATFEKSKTKYHEAKNDMGEPGGN